MMPATTVPLGITRKCSGGFSLLRIVAVTVSYLRSNGCCRLSLVEETLELAESVGVTRATIGDLPIFDAYTGARYGEIAVLSYDDIDLDKCRAKIDKTSIRVTGGAAKVKQSPKTAAGRRYVPLCPEVCEMLRCRIAQRKSRGCALVFPSPDGSPIPYSRTIRYIKAVADKMEVAIGWHSSRHYYASHLIRSGVPIPSVAMVMGHSNPMVTMSTYAHVLNDGEANDQVLAALSQLRIGKNGKPMGSVRLSELPEIGENGISASS